MLEGINGSLVKATTSDKTDFLAKGDLHMKNANWLVLVMGAVLLFCCLTTSCSSTDSATDGDATDGDMADGDATDGDVTDGDVADGDMTDGDVIDGDATDGDVIEGPECWKDPSSGEPVELLTGLMGSEGITFTPDGRLFISTKGEVLEVFGDGTVESFADELAHPLGMASDEAGNLMIADFGVESKKGDADGSLVRFYPDGQSERLAEGVISNPNYVTRTPWGSYLVSDDYVPEIWEVTDEGEATLWSNQVPSPNGMVFSADGLTLYVASTFEDPSPVYAIEIDGEAAGEVSLFANLGTNFLNDGVGMDEFGKLYVIANGEGKILRFDMNGGMETAAEGFFTPASMAFGEGENFDPCSAYVTELLGGSLWRVPLGVRGQPLFR
jgi:sugar lactone lactonase YvrE